MRIAVGAVVFAGAALAGDPRPVVQRSGLIETTSGHRIGYPDPILLAWPRSEVHKFYGRPARVLREASSPQDFAQPVGDRTSFLISSRVADVYEDREDLNPNTLWVYYEKDHTNPRLGINQRVYRQRVVLAQPQPLWSVLTAAGLVLPEAEALCTGFCELRRACEGERCYVWITQRTVEADRREIASLVATGYRSYRAEPDRAVAIRLSLKSNSWVVTEADVLPFRLSQLPGGCERLGLWDASR